MQECIDFHCLSLLLHSPAVVSEHLQQLVLVLDSEAAAKETRLLSLHSERILKAATASLAERRALASKETGGLGILCRCLEVSRSWEASWPMLMTACMGHSIVRTASVASYHVETPA